MVIVGTFTGTIVLVLISTAVIIGVSGSLEEAQKLSATLVSILESLGNFLTAVFAPLLAFVLGYYFGEKSSSK